MAMSRIAAIFLAALLVMFSACLEESDGLPALVESVAEIPVHQSPLRDGIDWNEELELVGSDEVLKMAAASAGTKPPALRTAMRIEADVSERKIRILAVHADAVTSKKFANAIATACMMVRSERESKRVLEKLSDLERRLNEQSTELDLASEPLFIPESADLERDLMTYEKARQALEENPPDDGVLYRKAPEEEK
jgi:hypothetical protein